jgi:hypothetical protein
MLLLQRPVNLFPLLPLRLHLLPRRRLRLRLRLHLLQRRQHQQRLPRADF